MIRHNMVQGSLVLDVAFVGFALSVRLNLRETLGRDLVLSKMT